MKLLLLVVLWSYAVSSTHYEDCSVVVEVSCEKNTTTLKMDENKIEQCLKNKAVTDCEHGLYNEERRFLVDPFADAQERLIKEMNTEDWKMTVRSCLPLMRWQFQCPKNPECKEVAVCYKYDKRSTDLQISSSTSVSHRGSWLTMLISLGVFVMMMG